MSNPMDPTTQVQEVAAMLGWEPIIPCVRGGGYMSTSELGLVNYFTVTEIATLHRVLTAGKRAREVLEELVPLAERVRFGDPTGPWNTFHDSVRAARTFLKEPTDD